LAIVAMVVIAMLGCRAPAPGPVPPDVVVSVDGGAERSESGPIDQETGPVVHDAEPETLGCRDLCCAMCTRLAALGCPESKPTPKGASCAEVCRAVQDFHGLDLKREALVSCQTVACVRRAGVACGN
jgi:hypothetical protein